MTRLVTLARATGLAFIAAICASTGALAECPDDCGALSFKLTYLFGEGAVVRAGYDSNAQLPIAYNGDRVGTASYGFAAEFVQPISLSQLSAGDIVAILREARFEASLNQALSGPDMHDLRFQATGSEFVGVNLYDAFHGTVTPDYGARFTLEVGANVGRIDARFPLLGISFDGTDGRTHTFGLGSSLSLFGDKTPGACAVSSEENCFTFSRGRFSFQALNIPEPGAWALLLAGFFSTGAVLRASRRRRIPAA